MMGLKTLFGTLLGFTTGFLIFGFWRGEFDWNLWIILLIGGTIGHFAIAFVKKTIKESKKE